MTYSMLTLHSSSIIGLRRGASLSLSSPVAELVDALNVRFMYTYSGARYLLHDITGSNPVRTTSFVVNIFTFHLVFRVGGSSLEGPFFLYPDGRSLDFGISRVVASSPGRHMPAGRSPYWENPCRPATGESPCGLGPKAKP